MTFVAGLRRALALLVLGLAFSLFGLLALLVPDPSLRPLFIGLAACYGLAFFGLAAEWFWARWFALGLGGFGSLSLLAVFSSGLQAGTLIWGGSHLAVVLCLFGRSMAVRYELSERWRQRWKISESSVQRLRSSVISAGFSLPFLVIYALGPEPEGLGPLAVAALALAALGVAGVARLRTWGLAAWGAAGALAAAAALAAPLGAGPAVYGVAAAPFGLLGALAAAGFLAAFLIFLGPMVRYLLRQRR